VISQRDEGTRRLNRLRRDDLDACFPGLLGLAVAQGRTVLAGWSPSRDRPVRGGARRQCGRGPARASRSRAMISFWISLVPSYSRYSRESRYIRSTTVELM
jgi:hypothetical protein